MRGDVHGREVAHSRAIVCVRPQVSDGVLDASADPWRFGEVEEHVSRLAQGVDKHENRPVLTRTTPVLSRICSIGGPIRIDAPAERRDTSAVDGILVDCDDFLILQDTDHFLADSSQL